MLEALEELALSEHQEGEALHRCHADPQ